MNISEKAKHILFLDAPHFLALPTSLLILQSYRHNVAKGTHISEAERANF
jgi:hypothetical protein